MTPMEADTCCTCGCDLDDTRVFGSCRLCAISRQSYRRDVRERGKLAADAALLALAKGK